MSYQFTLILQIYLRPKHPPSCLKCHNQLVSIFYYLLTTLLSTSIYNTTMCLSFQPGQLRYLMWSPPVVLLSRFASPIHWFRVLSHTTLALYPVYVTLSYHGLSLSDVLRGALVSGPSGRFMFGSVPRLNQPLWYRVKLDELAPCFWSASVSSS